MHIPFHAKGYLSGSMGLPRRPKREVWSGENEESWVLACTLTQHRPQEGLQCSSEVLLSAV